MSHILEKGEAFSLPLSEEKTSSSEESEDLEEHKSDKNITNESEKAESNKCSYAYTFEKKNDIESDSSNDFDNSIANTILS
ncbi:6729_t:CDS:2 [Racocetra fulgida]|uniref:6729_t:CDS:1 n=1 Tax=Racocetra fulgida TaxID=60492 RepID=A0A9N8Z470_9GLOM|nr:6729_t:CDS:2 [Racocetra fulgida]